MSDLKAVKGEVFPLRSSLFVPVSGKVDSTWRYLSEKLSEAQRQEMINWQVVHGMNTMIFLTYARGGDCEINPFVQTYGPDVNMTKAAKWFQRLEPGKHGANFIPCWLCDDDPEAASNVAFTNRYVPLACAAIGPYSRVVCAGLEMNEQYNTFKRNLSASAKAEHQKRFRDSMTRIIKICHDYTDKPVVVHLQWDMKSALPAGLDGLIYEHPWDPHEGKNHSADEAASIGAQVIARAGIPVGFNEYIFEPWTEHGIEMTNALSKLPCWLLGGPY